MSIAISHKLRELTTNLIENIDDFDEGLFGKRLKQQNTIHVKKTKQKHINKNVDLRHNIRREVGGLIKLVQTRGWHTF